MSETFFFVHVMKTGGSTFLQHLKANFGPGEVYPLVREDGIYQDVRALVALDLERRKRIRAYAGHFPYVAAGLVGADITLSMLRDPVDRTISFLRHAKRHSPRLKDAALEQIYEDPVMFPLLIDNYQTKIFSMTREDEPRNHMDHIVVDDERLALALDNLERVDVLGLHEHYDDFTAELRHRFGWTIEPVPDRRVSTDTWPLPDTLRARITADCSADMALYERARQIHQRRRPPR